MKRKITIDVVDMFQKFQNDVLEKKPDFEQMFSDVQMMQFKVRPVTGDIAGLNFDNYIFIETLWSLGKLDEFFHQHVTGLNKTEKKVFYQLFDGLYQQYQSQLNKVNLKTDLPDTAKTEGAFEVEIFREKKSLDN